MFACWENDARPKICGGPFTDTYEFYNLVFRWGPTDVEGSEHMIDSKRYAMEVQATHIKTDNKYVDIAAAANCKAVLIVSYLYEVSIMYRVE